MLAESTFTFIEAFSRAVAAESSTEQAKHIHSQKLNSGNSTNLIRQHSNSNKRTFQKSSSSQSKTENAQSADVICYGCGDHHDRSSCKFRDVACRFRKKKGHIERACRAKRKNDSMPRTGHMQKNSSTHAVKSESVNEAAAIYNLSDLKNSKCKQMKGNVSIQLGEDECIMELDSGSDYSIISSNELGRLWPNKKPKIFPLTFQLCDYQKSPILIRGQCYVNVRYVNFKEFKDVFSEDLGSYEGPAISLPIDPKFPPISFKARNIPLAMRKKVDVAIDKFLDQGVLETISNPKWSTPIVPIIKQSGEIRLCADYKVTINKAMKNHPYPIPSVNHILTNLADETFFAKIDLAQAYLQLRVDASAEAQTIVTHRGAFKLIKKEWKWTSAHEKAFAAVKELLSLDSVLVPFNEKLPLILTYDASPYGVGYVLSHLMPDGGEAQIACASRTLTSTERNYSQLDKEALSIIAGVQKFHYFLYGHTFTLFTDHQPLLGLFNKMKLTPDILSPRMLRWSQMLNAYDFTIIHRPGKKIQNADALSRLPLETPETDIPSPPEVLFLEELHNPLVKADEISKATLRDPVLSRVLNWVLKVWPESAKECRIFYLTRHELSVHKNCLLWGSRGIILEVLRRTVLDELHISHPGIQKMKSLARWYVWWPKIEEDIENHVGLCEPCQQTRHAPPRAPVHPWKVTTKPWSRVHIDFAGPFQGQMFFLLVDSFSKWLEVKRLSSATCSATIKVREKFLQLMIYRIQWHPIMVARRISELPFKKWNTAYSCGAVSFIKQWTGGKGCPDN
ncbi:Uncharacterized protein K02A2.6 [Araneus ventricosus]|uniref:RNA-directed DNA polymerase n=1 Tax=Araneus ventricosus TaxID=182803 RepID=A0A4Y2H0K1_ARAVE|nr:Uncharacterized protein K02A2.6 [Araneus ventricosus]